MDNHRYLPKGEAMHISLQKICAIVIILGSVLFLIAAFSPISHRVFPEPSAARKLESSRLRRLPGSSLRSSSRSARWSR